jgi:organic radical activating enzyme
MHATRISEVFLSLQGEGPSAGTPAHFVRLQGCRVGCTWCDTKYAWEPDAGAAIDFDDLWSRAHELGEAPLLVVTGGEPLEHPELGTLLDQALARWSRVEVETSGIAAPPRSHPRLAWNVSPKLPSATSRWQDTWAHAAAWVAEPGATFKIVVGDDPDFDDALRLIGGHAIPRDRVLFMPEGMTDESVRAHATALAPRCVRHGIRLGPRLHVWMWGAKRGV